MKLLQRTLSYAFKTSKGHAQTHYKRLTFLHGIKDESVGEAKHKLIKWLLKQTNNKKLSAQLAKLLTEQSALLEATQTEQLFSEVLCYMASHGHAAEVTFLLSQGVEPDSCDAVSQMQPFRDPPCLSLDLSLLFAASSHRRLTLTHPTSRRHRSGGYARTLHCMCS